MASITDRWISEGKTEGLVETLLLQVKQKFTGASTQHEDQVRSASLEQLKDWLSRLLETQDPETLFDTSGGGAGAAHSLKGGTPAITHTEPC